MTKDYTTERTKTNNLTLLTDLYQLTMMNGYRRCKLDERRAVFDISIAETAAIPTQSRQGSNKR